MEIETDAEQQHRETKTPGHLKALKQTVPTPAELGPCPPPALFTTSVDPQRRQYAAARGRSGPRFTPASMHAPNEAVVYRHNGIM